MAHKHIVSEGTLERRPTTGNIDVIKAKRTDEKRVAEEHLRRVDAGAQQRCVSFSQKMKAPRR